VIPNKVFQILATGTPLITRDSPAIRELLSPDTDGVWLIPPADPAALASAVSAFAAAPRGTVRPATYSNIMARITPRSVGTKIMEDVGGAPITTQYEAA
jgi:glycosyltransferase involved in cell wall biosynthesis